MIERVLKINGKEVELIQVCGGIELYRGTSQLPDGDTDSEDTIYGILSDRLMFTIQANAVNGMAEMSVLNTPAPQASK